MDTLFADFEISVIDALFGVSILTVGYVMARLCRAPTGLALCVGFIPLVIAWVYANPALRLLLASIT